MVLVLAVLELCDFIVSEKEDSVLAGIKESAFIYSVQKSCLKPDNVFKHHIAAMSNSEHMEASTVTYLSIIDMHADTLEVMSQVASVLYREYIDTTSAQHLIVAGDAKTYLRLKKHYGNEMDWLLPFIGDWHVLYNYQKTLMKVYFEAGLKHLACKSGYRAETLTSLAKASNFKRTHSFIMQVLEAFYKHFYDVFLSEHNLEKLKICSCFVTRAVMMESLMKHMCDILTV